MCCNLSGGAALIVWFTTNGMCIKNNTIMYVARTSNNTVEWSRWVIYCYYGCNWDSWKWWLVEAKSDRGVEALPILTCEPLNVTTSVRGEWSWHVNSIVACCHSAKLCAYAARDFRSQQYAPNFNKKRSFIEHMKHYVKAYRCSSNVTLLPFFKHDFYMFLVKSYQRRNLKKMPRSQNECSWSRLNEKLLVKWDCDLIE